MQNYQFKICNALSINFALIIFNFIFCIVSAGTLEDIRNKTGWQSPNHSERNAANIPIITPTELIANLNKYHKDVIKMRALFHSVTMRELNVWILEGGHRSRWSSKKYISFRIKDPKKKVSNNDIYMFISKRNPDADKVFDLSHDTPIVITGRVRNTAKGKAWVEVFGIE